MKHLMVATLAVALSGCALKGQYQAYEGPLRADAEQARVLLPAPGHPLAGLVGTAQTRISCVDGKSTGRFFGYHSFGYTHAPEAVVTPGRHNLTATFSARDLSGYQTVWFDAEPGHTYYVRHEILGNNIAGRYIRVQVQDKDSGKMVSRVMNKQPDPKDDEVPAAQRCRA